MIESEYDVIIIGSGIGALATASLLVQFSDRKVLVIEKHGKPGGYTHTFKRKKYEFDVGLHYVGELEKGMMMRTLFDVVSQNQIQWRKMPELFEAFVYPDFTIKVSEDKNRYIEELSARYPDEKDAIQKYFLDVQSTAREYINRIMSRSMPSLKSFMRAVSFEDFDELKTWTVEKYMNEYFRDEKLKAILVSQWGDYGLPPEKASFIVHSSVVSHYLNGAYYPAGGSASLARNIGKIINENGSQIVVNAEVEEILMEDGRAVGVRFKQKGAIFTVKASVVVSNAGSYLTYNQLMPEPYCAKEKKEIKLYYKKYPPASSICLFVGFKEDPRRLGFEGENHWIYSGYDHSRTYQSSFFENGTPSAVYLSFPSLKNPETSYHTAEIMLFGDQNPFEKWRNQPGGQRDPDYYELKEQYAKKIIQYVDAKYPGFAENVAFHELSNPFTNEFYTGHYNGEIYGVPAVPERFCEHSWVGIETPVENIYLTGADAFLPGIGGSLLGGVLCAMKILEEENPRLFFMMLRGKK